MGCTQRGTDNRSGLLSVPKSYGWPATLTGMELLTNDPFPS